MSGSRRPPDFPDDNWILAQQMRAELEAEAWRQLRHQRRALPPPAPPAPPPSQPPILIAPPRHDPIETSGSIVFKALVRFIMATCGAYLAWLSAVDSRAGEFEVWLSTLAGFAVTLSLTMFTPLRGVVHVLAETMRWVIVVALGIAVLWLVTHSRT